MSTETKGEGLSFAQTGRAGPLVGLAFKIFLLNIVTLTLYRFWGRTEVRRFLWGSTTINGEPLEYTGTGMELFLGFLFALFLVLLPLGIVYGVIFALVPPTDPKFALCLIGIYVVTIYLFAFGYYRAWRYRLSRTTWRGVRFALAEKGYSFGLKALGLFVLSIFTLGLLVPFADARLTRRLLRDMRFGDRPFHSEAKARSLYLAFVLSLILSLLLYLAWGGLVFVLLGPDFSNFEPGTMPRPEVIVKLYALIFALVPFLAFAQSFYAARRLRVFAGTLRLEGATFSLDATAMSLYGLTLSNMLIIVFSLGILMPIAELRLFHYLFSRLSAEGTVDLAAIVQGNADQPKTGEGLAEAFGFGTV